MKVLVTGGCGFIGSAVIRHALNDSDSHIINVDKLTYAATPEALGLALRSRRCQLEQEDVCDAKAMRRIFASHQPDAVMHLAAESHVDRSIDGPAEFIQTNIVGTFVLLEAARDYWSNLPPGRRAAFRFHHVSTDEVYGALLPSSPAFAEDSPYRPRSAYSASKASADHLVRAWAETYGLPTLITNCSNNYGPWQFPEKFIPLIISSAFDRRPLPVYGAGENIRDWLHVEDHARALWLVLHRGRAGETYNIGGGCERRNIDVVRAVCALMDVRNPGGAPHERLISFVPDRPGHDFRYAISSEKLQRELGWRPDVTFQEGLARTVEWYGENQSWWRRIRKTLYDGRRLGLATTAAAE
jgi:dTDP-glucose 4,6-dehydratase